MFPVQELTEAQRQHFAQHGWLLLRDALSQQAVRQVQGWMAEVAVWAEAGAPGMHHHEATPSGARLARSEDLLDHHAGLASLLTEGLIPGAVGALLGEPAVLFKEKCNYKYPGGGGFAPHQDAPAYRFADHHISCMVPLDPATEASGCLWVASGKHTEGTLPMEGAGRIDPKVAEGLDWQPVPVFPGDVLLFDSYTPHKSGTNTADHPRRALYLTYNALSKGDLREAYYADKRAEFAQHDGTFGDGTRVRMSINDDFLGVPVQVKRPLTELLERFAGPRAEVLYDEAVTELDHALQCAELAAAEGAHDALVAAALLHDVGHLLLGDHFPLDEELPKDFKHEEVGARYLSRWFGPEVSEPVRLHVAAKRYLVSVDTAYGEGLSACSVRSLAQQGGPMTPMERAAFERNPYWRDAVAVRRWDDLAKDTEAKPRPFKTWEGVLLGLRRGGA